MNRNNARKILGIILALLVLVVNYSPQVRNFTHIPSEIRVIEGEEHVIDIGFPLNMIIEADKTGMLHLNGELMESNKTAYNTNEPIRFQMIGSSNINLKFKIFGIIPIKTLTISPVPRVKLIPGGESIGVALYTKGALVVGTSDVRTMDGRFLSPADDAGILPGDIIVKVNNIEVKNADHITEIINNSNFNTIELEVIRGEKSVKTSIVPVKDSRDGEYRLGMWVRDSTVGVGTLTFFCSDKNIYGALGHAITDIDTGSLLSVKEGEIMKSRVVSIKQGKKGEPGEIKGVFSANKDIIGNIKHNTQYGIYGNIYEDHIKELKHEPMPIMLQSQVKEGPAKILSTIDDQGVRPFEIEIVRVNRQTGPSTKGIVIKITDEELLEKTGGIVQGMSGSPIIQNNKIVGAVTHVFINDPAKGYGLFIEWMMIESQIIS